MSIDKFLPLARELNVNRERLINDYHRDLREYNNQLSRLAEEVAFKLYKQKIGDKVKFPHPYNNGADQNGVILGFELSLEKGQIIAAVQVGDAANTIHPRWDFCAVRLSKR